MYAKNFVICDGEKQYAHNLAQKLNRRRKAEIQMFLFHTVEELMKFARQKPIHLLLIGDEYSQKQRMQIPAEERYVLTKSLSEPLAENEQGIYRYQNAGKIWSQIFETAGGQKFENQFMNGVSAACEELENLSVHTAVCTQGELIAVYSPVHRIGKTAFALELGRTLALKEPVLYLNLEEYAGGEYFFKDRQNQTLADLLYYFRQGKSNLAIRIGMMVGQDEKLDYILPMPYAQDMRAVKKEEWLRLFQRILQDCIYEKVILDLGDSVDGLFEILDSCGRIYTPYIEDEVSMAKLKQYFENLRRTGRDAVLEKTVQKRMQR